MSMAMGAAGSPERRLMQRAVRQSMEDGAFGVASALVYPPGNFASTDELISINAAAAPYGGVYITHMRSEGDLYLEAIDEAIEIGTSAGVPIEIYHLKAAGQRNWDKADDAVAKIDSARTAGVDVQANMYPYTAGGTGLDACFPPWASADGALFDNLADPEMRQRIRAEMEVQTEPWEAFCSLATPGGTMPLGLNLPAHQQYRGWWLEDIAEDMGKDWVDTAMDLVLGERQRVSTMYFLMSEENVAMQIAQPWMKFGTDAGGIDPETATGLAHPRAYGTFARVLGKYVREEGVIGLEDAVRKMSSAVATRLQIRDRGFLREGYFADIVIFDPDTVTDHATYDKPHQLSTGIDFVFVNGVAVVRDGAVTGAMPGRAVRGPGWTGWDR
jgi:dihydroorotase/N-acyl-D-amino-acid deacylase